MTSFRSHRVALAFALLFAQAASLGHLVFARHTVCAESGHLAEAATAQDQGAAIPEGLSQGSASDSDEHCVVIDAAQAPALFGQTLVLPVWNQPLVSALEYAREGWSRTPLINAPKASPPKIV